MRLEHNPYAILTDMKRRWSAGYTILEVMIVLTVSALLFAAVARTLSGRRSQNESTQAVRDFESKLQGVANDVINGYYPNGFNCSADAGGSAVNLTATTSTGGTNVGCIFLGKVIAFDSTDADIITTIGRQYIGAIGSADVSNLTEAKPVAVAISGADVTDNYVYNYGLRVTKMVQLSDNNTNVGAIAFMSQLSGGIGGSNPLTGSRSVLLYGMNGTTPNTDSTTTTAGKINASGSLIALPDGVRICLRGGNDQKAEVTVGAGGNQTSTFVTLDSGVDSVCP